MSNVIRFAHPRKVREEVREAMREQACALLARLDAEPSEAHIGKIGAWLAEDPAHVEVFLEMASLWDQVSVLSELSEVFPLKQYGPVSGQRAHRGGLLAAAAAILLVVLTLGFGWGYMDGEHAKAVEVAVAEGPSFYETRVGEQTLVKLDDGSQMILNTNTRVEVSYSPSERSVVLERGEGYFIVAKDAARPFRVYAGSRVVEAIGTAFTVHTQDESMQVTVTEGKVKLLKVEPPLVPASELPTDAAIPVPSMPLLSTSLPSTSLPSIVDAPIVVSLAAGEFADVSIEDDLVEMQKMNPAEMEVRLAWRHGMLLFQDEPLEEVLREVSRYTSVRLEVEDAVRDIHVGGYFRAGDIDTLLAAMQLNFPLDVQHVSDDHIILKAR